MAYGLRYEKCQERYYMEFLGNDADGTKAASAPCMSQNEALDAMHHRRRHGEFPGGDRPYCEEGYGDAVAGEPQETHHHHKLEVERQTGRRFVIEGRTVTCRRVADGDALAAALEEAPR